MNKYLMISILGVGLAACSGKTTSVAQVTNDPAQDKATVYFTKDISPESLVKIYKALNRPATGRVAVKISTGEAGNPNYLKPALIKNLVDEVHGTIVECNTAYAGKRTTNEEHMQVIRDHGFLDIASVDIMDAEGEFQIPVKDKTHIQYDIVGTHLKNYDFMINLAHFKGHPMGGLGGVLKNQSIGVASANGKAYIHSSGRVQSPDVLWTRENIEDQDGFLESMAAAAQGVADYFGDKILYISVLNNMTVDCDCVATPEPVYLKDMGIMASLDPVALDQACVDMVFNHASTEGDDAKPLQERINRQHGTHTIDHAEKIGLGTKNYTIVSLD